MSGFQSSSFDKKATGLALVKATGIRSQKVTGSWHEVAVLQQKRLQGVLEEIQNYSAYGRITGGLLGWSREVLH